MKIVIVSQRHCLFPFYFKLSSSMMILKIKMAVIVISFTVTAIFIILNYLLSNRYFYHFDQFFHHKINLLNGIIF